jgi:hypothetical protein
MKLRCTQNSIRLRLRKSDMQTLQTTQEVTESVYLPGGTVFAFQLKLSNVEAITANMEGQTIVVSIPIEAGQQWIDSNQVGFEEHLPLATGQQLHLLIEKDFPCAHQPHEDKSDTFEELV